MISSVTLTKVWVIFRLLLPPTSRKISYSLHARYVLDQGWNNVHSLNAVTTSSCYDTLILCEYNYMLHITISWLQSLRLCSAHDYFRRLRENVFVQWNAKVIRRITIVHSHRSAVRLRVIQHVLPQPGKRPKQLTNRRGPTIILDSSILISITFFAKLQYDTRGRH